MGKYRLRTKTVQAEPWDGSEEQALKLGLVSYVVKERNAQGWAIYKSGRYTFVSKGDYIIKDENGNLANLAPKDFAKRYEEAAPF
jgi:hypothetical protein